MLKNVLATAAAAGIVLAPMAAQAGTRASESSVSLASIAGEADRIGSPVGESEDIAGRTLLFLIIFLLASGFTLHEIFTSPGIFK